MIRVLFFYPFPILFFLYSLCELSEKQYFKGFIETVIAPFTVHTMMFGGSA